MVIAVYLRLDNVSRSFVSLVIIGANGYGLVTGSLRPALCHLTRSRVDTLSGGTECLAVDPNRFVISSCSTR